MTDPFSVLGLDETAGDDEIKRRYLALVRAFPPDREPQRFQEFRSAYEALHTERERLRVKLLQTNGAALSRLKLFCLQPAGPVPCRASRATVAALLAEGMNRPYSE